MLCAVLIYGTNFAISRHGILNGLTPNDMAALRFAGAGLLLLPFFLRWGVRDCAGLGWGRGIAVTVMSGVPLTMLMMYGLKFSPAAHGATITPGTVTVIGVIGSALLFGNRPPPLALAGIGVVLGGLACIGAAAGVSGSSSILLGDAMFLCAGLVWGFYPLMLQSWKIDSLRATAALSVLSALVFLPFYAASGGGNLAQVPLWIVLAHGFNQAVLNVIVGLWLWGYAVKEVGAAYSGRFPPLIPVIGTLSAIPLVGEWPGTLQWAGVALIVTGLLVAARARG
jgi:drug/metabolite transporter (DMT)-like permease